MNVSNVSLFKITFGSITIEMEALASNEEGVRIIATENDKQPFFNDAVIKGEASKNMNSGQPGSHQTDVDADVAIDQHNNIFFDGTFFEGSGKQDSHKFELKIGLPMSGFAFKANHSVIKPIINCKYPASIGSLTLNAEPEAASGIQDTAFKRIKFDVFEYEDNLQKQYGPEKPVDEGKSASVNTRHAGKSHLTDFDGHVKVNSNKAVFEGILEFEGNQQVSFYLSIKF